MIVVSTSGFSYRDWIGPFYPPGTASGDMLPFFARFFSAVELNYSYYSLPGERGLASILRKAPGKKFALKAHKSFTHERSFGGAEVKTFRRALDMLRGEGALLSLLAQFPFSFQPREENLDYLRGLAAAFEGYPLAVEFRHGSWKQKPVFELMGELGLSLVTTDAPAVGNLFRGGWENVGPFGYVRLHGRNAEKWYEHKHAWERYDYLYSAEQISKIAEAVRRLAGEGENHGAEQEKSKRDTYVFFNNHWQAQGVVNALQLSLILGRELPEGIPAAIRDKLDAAV